MVMSKRRFKLSPGEVSALQGAYHNSRNGPVRTRFQAVRLYGEGYGVGEIEKLCGSPRSSVMTWCRTYRTEGIAGLLDQRKGGNCAKLQPGQIEKIGVLLHTYTPAQLWGREGSAGASDFWTVVTLARLVEERCGVLYQSDNSYRSLFRKCGFTRQRPGFVYRSRSEQAVMVFEEELEKN